MTCTRKIGPFDCCSVVQGDCLELMKLLPEERLICECGMDVTGEGGLFHVVGGHKNKAVKCFDAVVTDPPYGINAARDRHSEKWGWTDFPVSGWDKERPNPEVFAQMFRVSNLQCIWGGNYFTDALPPRGKWLIWDKGQSEFSLADAELAWTSLTGATRRIEYPRALALKDGKVHHTQKPLAVMVWNLEQFPDAESILDPFCGSGTTLVAAAKLGRHFLGFEISEEYCEIARKRLALVEAQPTLFQPKPEQTELEL